MTRPWPATGRPGGDAGHPRSTRPGYGCSNGNAAVARSAGNCSCTPTESHSIPTNGSSGSRPSARRPASRRSPSARGPERKVDPQCSALSTATADAASQTATAVDQHFRRPDPMHAFGLARAGCPESGHGRFRGGGGAATRRRYPTGGRTAVFEAQPAYRSLDHHDLRGAAGFCLIERQVRTQIAPQTKIPGLYAGRPARPTGWLIFLALAGMRLIPATGDQPAVIPQPTLLQQRLLDFLQVDPLKPP